MIIDLPVGADENVLFQAAVKVGVKLQPYDGPWATNTRDIGEVWRFKNVTIRPAGADTLRAYSPDRSGDAGLGRRKNAVCWHGHRDWMRAVLEQVPNAAIRSSRATYLGMYEFERNHENTRPDERAEVCRCED